MTRDFDGDELTDSERELVRAAGRVLRREDDMNLEAGLADARARAGLPPSRAGLPRSRAGLPPSRAGLPSARVWARAARRDRKPVPAGWRRSGLVAAAAALALGGFVALGGPDDLSPPNREVAQDRQPRNTDGGLPFVGGPMPGQPATRSQAATAESLPTPGGSDPMAGGSDPTASGNEPTTAGSDPTSAGNPTTGSPPRRPLATAPVRAAPTPAPPPGEPRPATGQGGRPKPTAAAARPPATGRPPAAKPSPAAGRPPAAKPTPAAGRPSAAGPPPETAPPPAAVARTFACETGDPDTTPAWDVTGDARFVGLVEVTGDQPAEVIFEDGRGVVLDRTGELAPGQPRRVSVPVGGATELRVGCRAPDPSSTLTVRKLGRSISEPETPSADPGSTTATAPHP